MTIYTNEHTKHRKFTTRIPTLYTKFNELVEYTDCDVAFFVQYKNEHHCFRSRHDFPDQLALNASYQTPDDWVRKNPGLRNHPGTMSFRQALPSPGGGVSSSKSSTVVFATPPPEPVQARPTVQREQPSTPQTRSMTRMAGSLPKLHTIGVSDLPLRNLAPEAILNENLPTGSTLSPMLQKSPWKIKPAPRRSRSESETPSPLAIRKSLKRKASAAPELDDDDDEDEDDDKTPSFRSPVTRSRLRGLKNFKFSMF
ncbi:hypothetical protein BKA61DRAFT_54893 [Leptodontidium sp. MPI-SDFR-AT-0119]|nr:hypothetical protein BKA61DRAFT_54893 [Leptodontidium sp. MPI-SDFR-AT-0119]